MADVQAVTHDETISSALDYSDDELSLWIRNRHKTTLSFNVQSPNGDIKTISIARTWIPIDLSLYAKKSNIEQSPDFRLIKARGWIEILTAQQVKKIFEDPSAIKEAERILNVNNISITDSNAVPVDIETQSATEEEIALARIQSSGEANAINEVKILQMRGELSDSLKAKILLYAQEEKLDDLVEML